MESRSQLRARARNVVLAFATTLALGIILLLFFEPDVQQVGAGELVQRSDDARPFLIADYVFIGPYGLVSPIAYWRFGRSTGEGTVPGWIKLAAIVGVAAGLVDALENALLLSATGAVSTGAVGTAHDLAPLKVGLFVLAAAFGIAVVVKSIRLLGRG